MYNIIIEFLESLLLSFKTLETIKTKIAMEIDANERGIADPFTNFLDLPKLGGQGLTSRDCVKNRSL